MEEMLRSWFPDVKLQDQVVVAQTEKAVPTKKSRVSCWRKKKSCVTAADGAHAEERVMTMQLKKNQAII